MIKSDLKLLSLTIFDKNADVRGEGCSGSRTFADKGEGGVLNGQNCADVLYGRPLRVMVKVRV